LLYAWKAKGVFGTDPLSGWRTRVLGIRVGVICWRLEILVAGDFLLWRAKHARCAAAVEGTATAAEIVRNVTNDFKDSHSDECKEDDKRVVELQTLLDKTSMIGA